MLITRSYTVFRPHKLKPFKVNGSAKNRGWVYALKYRYLLYVNKKYWGFLQQFIFHVKWEQRAVYGTRGVCFEADTMFRYSFKILPDRLKLIRLYPCWVSRAKYQFRLRSSSWPFCSDSPEWRSRHMVTWFGRHGDAFSTTENAFISCIYDPQITVSPTSSFSASFNGNCVKNHP